MHEVVSEIVYNALGLTSSKGQQCDYRDVEKCHNVEVCQSLSKLILTPPLSLDINEVNIP